MNRYKYKVDLDNRIDKNCRRWDNMILDIIIYILKMVIENGNLSNIDQGLSR